MNLTIAPELLIPKEPSTAGFRGALWVKNGKNIFRGVIEYRCKNEKPAELADVVRDIVKREFKPGHFIPFAFGAILHFDRASPEATEMTEYIDTKARWRDTWQWLIVCDHGRKNAFGIHTWLHGYLRPVYEDLLKQLEAQGYKCTSQDRAVDQLFTRIWALNARLFQAKQVLLLLLAALTLFAVAAKLLGVWK